MLKRAWTGFEMERENMNEKKQQKTQFELKTFLQNKRYLSMCLFILISIIVAVVGVAVLKIAVVPVCVILILEVGVAVCLSNEPIWMHGLVLLCEVVAGIFLDRILFILLVGCIYLASIYTLKYWKEA